MDKQTVVYHYNGILFRYKKYKVYICAIIWMILKNVKLSKKRQKQNVLYCTFFFFFNETSSRDKSTERAYYSSPGEGRKQYLIGVECSSGVMKCLKLERDDGCATL